MSMMSGPIVANIKTYSIFKNDLMILESQKTV